MSVSNAEDNTQTKVTPPVVNGVETDEQNYEAPTKTRKRLSLWILFGLVLILVGTAAGGGLGYASGIKVRLDNYAKTVTLNAVTQFQLGLVDQNAGNYEVARQRFEYVIRLDPKFPGAAQHLQEVELAMAQIKTPTPVPILPTLTPTVILTPTQDLRNEDDLFKQVDTDLRGKDWQGAIVTLDTLRKLNLKYKAIQADGMYYIALRFLGLQMITKDHDLEGGLYRLALAERFAPLDHEANEYRSWARYYQTGASFWEADWAKVVYYFQQINDATPGLMDQTLMTASQRYRIALIKYGDQLMKLKKYCDAEQQYQIALQLVDDKNLQPTAEYAANRCHPPAATQPPIQDTLPPEPSATVIQGPTAEPPTASPTTEPSPTKEPPTPTDTEVPTATPSATP